MPATETTRTPEQRRLDQELIEEASEGNLARLKELLAQGANPRAVNALWPRDNALSAATLADENAAECVAFLLPLSDANHAGPNGSALNCAASQGDAESVRLLIPACDASILDEDGHTALMCAILAGSVECAKQLIPVSDLNARAHGGRAGRNALMVAASSGDKNTGAFIALLAAEMTDEELNAVDEEGATALMLAVLFGPDEGPEVDFAPLLGRADANLRNNEKRWTALNMAIGNGNLREVQALAPFTKMTATAYVPPIELAAKQERWEIAEFLAPISARKDADWALDYAQGRMPLWLAHCEEEALRQVVQEASAAHEEKTEENGLPARGARLSKNPAKRTPRAL